MDPISNAIYLVSVIISLATLIALLREKRPMRAIGATYLMVYLFCLSISNVFIVIISSELILFAPHLFKVFMPLSFITPVAGFLYIKYSLEQKNHSFYGIWLHYIPALIIAIHYLPFMFKSAAFKVDYLQQIMENPELIVTLRYGWLFNEKQVLLIRSVQTLFYLAFSYQAIRRFRSKNIAGVLVEKNARHFQWIKFFFWSQLVYFTLIHVLYLIFNNQFNGVVNNFFFEKLAFISTSVIVLLISSYLIINPKLLLIAGEVIRSKPQIQAPLSQALSLLDEIREKQLYKDPTMNQPKLATELNINPGELNVLIKAAGFENFNKLINDIRLEIFIAEAKGDQLKINSIEGIANTCGFNSSSTFYRVFKDKYGISPKQYLSSSESIAL